MYCDVPSSFWEFVFVKLKNSFFEELVCFYSSLVSRMNQLKDQLHLIEYELLLGLVKIEIKWTVIVSEFLH